MTYLHKIDDVRDFILSDIYDIPPCVIPIEGLIDTCFEYSILANLCLVNSRIFYYLYIKNDF